MTLIHWQVTFSDAIGGQVAQRPVQYDGDEAGAIELAKSEWQEFASSAYVRAYPICEVSEDGRHATDGQRLLSPTEFREVLNSDPVDLDLPEPNLPSRTRRGRRR